MKTVIVKDDVNGDTRCILVEKGQYYSKVLNPMHEINLVSNDDIEW